MKIAHRNELTQELQSVAEHSLATAEMASGFSVEPLKDFIYDIGMLHDIGKDQQ